MNQFIERLVVWSAKCPFNSVTSRRAQASSGFFLNVTLHTDGCSVYLGLRQGLTFEMVLRRVERGWVELLIQ